MKSVFFCGIFYYQMEKTPLVCGGAHCLNTDSHNLQFFELEIKSVSVS